MNMVVIRKAVFEEILGGRTSHKITTCIERFYGLPINHIPLEELLIKIKDIYRFTGMIENADIDKGSYNNTPIHLLTLKLSKS